MSGHGLEEGSREGKVAVLDEEGEISESEHLRLRAIIYTYEGDMKEVGLAAFPAIYGALVCSVMES